MRSTALKKRTRPGSADFKAAQAVERIVLTGFMGSGKSTVGRSLAQRLGWRFVDLDNLIEQRDGRAVSRIFAESGEAAFRALESEALFHLLQQSRLVVALGGGALETTANRQALNATSLTCTVLLTASFEILYTRCERQIAAAGSPLPVRPLLGDRETAAARLARREDNYRRTANVVLDTTSQQPHESVDALLTLLRSIL